MHLQLTRAEAAEVRRQFTIRMCMLEQAQLYWSPSRRRIIARSLPTSGSGGALRQTAVPIDAVLIGEYERGFDSRAFLEDLVDVIAELDWTERRQARVGVASCA